MITKEEFDKYPADMLFRQGFVSKGEDKWIKFIAKKGRANDWTIYIGNFEWEWERIRDYGNKAVSEQMIKKCVAIDDEVFKKYRY